MQDGLNNNSNNSTGASADKILIEEILGGSRAAMEVLVNKYYKTIFSYIYRSIGHYHTSYDLTQEVFIKMMKSISKFDSTVGSFQSWIFKIAVNSVKDYFKSSGYRAFHEAIEVNLDTYDENSRLNKSNRSRSSGSGNRDAAVDVGDSDGAGDYNDRFDRNNRHNNIKSSNGSDNVVEMVSRMEESEEIKKAILQLDENKREAIILRFYHDMKIKDIARITDTNESTIKSRLRLGIDKLRTILKEGGENDDQGFGV